MLGNQITPESLNEVAARGISHLEIPIAPDRDQCVTPAEYRRIGDLITCAGLTVWSVHAPFGAAADLGSPDELKRREAVSQVRRACEVAADLKANCLVIHAGNAGDDEQERRLRRRQSLRSLNCLLKLACRLDVRLAVEFMAANKPRLCNESAEMQEVLSLCDGSPGVCLDTNHANLAEDLTDVTRTLGDLIATVHLSDNDGQQEMHLTPGEGVINWPGFMTVLDEICYEGPLMYETVINGGVERCLDETVRSAREVLGWEAPDG